MNWSLILVLGSVWFALAALLAWGIGRWFRSLRELDGETPWEPSGIFDDVEVRWRDGYVESRTVRR